MDVFDEWKKKKLYNMISPIVDALPQQEVSNIPFEYGGLADRTGHTILAPVEQTATNASFQAMGGQKGVNATTGDIGELQAPNMGVSPTAGRYIGMAAGLAPSFFGGNEGSQASNMAKAEQKFGKVLMREEPAAANLGKVVVKEPAAANLGKVAVKESGLEKSGKALVKEDMPIDELQMELQMTKNRLMPYAKKVGVGTPENIIDRAADESSHAEGLLSDAGAPGRLVQRMKETAAALEKAGGTLVKSKARKALMD